MNHLVECAQLLPLTEFLCIFRRTFCKLAFKPVNMIIKTSIFYYLILLISGLIFSCSESSTTRNGDDQFQLDFDKISSLLVERMSLEEGEKVLLVASPGRFDQLIPALSTQLKNSGAQYLGTISVSSVQPEEWDTEFTINSQGLDENQLQEYLMTIDLGVMLPGATPDDKVYRLIQENLKDSVGRTIHFHWAGAYELNGIVMDIDTIVDEHYQRFLLETDYESLSQSQDRFEMAIRQGPIRVTTPDGTDISFRIGDRPVTKQNGNATKAITDLGVNLIDREIELPAGAIRTAPLEESVNGIIVFPDGMWNGGMVRGLKLSIDKGKVITMEAEEGIEYAQTEIENAGEAGKSFREFALGMNPLMAIPENDPWIPYYGYGAGVVRLSLGNNHELGGNVREGDYVRWNFFTDASVFVGEDQWVENGKLIK